MSYITMRINDVIDSYNQFIADFMGSDIEFEKFRSRLPLSFRSGYIRPWRALDSSETGFSKIKVDDKEFQINLDVKQFKHNELMVKLVDGFIVVEGKHDERQDEHGFISRHFVRRYKLPKNIVPEEVVSQLSSDGILTLTAPTKSIQGNVREIPIAIIDEPSVKSPTEEKIIEVKKEN